MCSSTTGLRVQQPTLRLQRWIGHLFWYSGLTTLARLCQRRRGTARIVAYHHVLPASDSLIRAHLPWTMYTDADAFARQMGYIAHHYHRIPLSELVGCLERGDTIPTGSIVITLDDAYQDQVEYALPILRASDAPATVCVVGSSLNRACAGSHGPGSDVVGGTDDWNCGRAQFAAADQLRVARADGIHLAAHGGTHCDLTECGADVLRSELVGVRQVVHALGDTGALFCYPGGRYNDAVRQAVIDAGYRAALSCEPGANSIHTDRFALRRTIVGASPDHFVAAQLAGLLDGPAWVYRRLNRLRFGTPPLDRQREKAPNRGAANQSGCCCTMAPQPILPPLASEQWPRVTVVVPTYNEHDMIDQCLRSLTGQVYPHDSLEILVIDGGSADDTVARARTYSAVRVLHNPAGNAERAKEIGLREARGDLFLYLDADAELSHPLWLQTMTLPLRDDATVVASFTRFVARSRMRPIDRYLNYHPLQLGPLLDELCVDIEDTKVAARPGYTLCCFSEGRVPPVGLCLYRLDVLRRVAHENPAFQWIDVGVPEMLTKAGYAHFAYAPSAGIHHGRPTSLGKLIAKQRRNVSQVYFHSVDTRDFRYVEFSSCRAVLRLLWWVVKVNLVLPPLWQAIRDSWRRRDLACLYKLPHAVLETNVVAIEFLRNAKGRALLVNGASGWARRINAYYTLRR